MKLGLIKTRFKAKFIFYVAASYLPVTSNKICALSRAKRSALTVKSWEKAQMRRKVPK